MHLPFTYATGEALLYQSNHPIAGYRDGGQEKNGSKSKKSRTERLVRDGLDPGSLLGALMSQDESVYVCQPALEPKMTFHSSFFGEQMGFSDSEPSGLRRSWDEPTNGVVAPSITESGISFDPLLATLDSLSLEGQGVVDAEDGGCSNGELFGALEGLGLSAEDLELLLLDERMIRVEMDPERVPTLDDLLTNDEILSYIYDSIEGKTASTEPGGLVPLSSASVTSTTLSLPDNNPTSDVQMPFPHCKPPLLGQAPILQLSQQMQQHLSMRSGKGTHEWGQHGDHLANTVVNGDLLGQNQSIPNGQWTSQEILSSAGLQLEHFNTQQTVFSDKASEHQHYLQQQPRTQKQQSQQCHAKQKAANLNGLRGVSSAEHSAGKWQDYGFSESLDGTSHKPPADSSLVSCMDYSMSDVDHAGYIGGSGLFARSGQQQADQAPSFQGMNHKRQPEQIPVPLAQVISSLSQCPPPNTSLEQILGVSTAC